MLEIIKIPLDSIPLLFIKESIQEFDNIDTVLIVPTKRNMRAIAALKHWNMDIQTVQSFTKRANATTGVLIPKELRSYYFYKAVQKFDKSELFSALDKSANSVDEGYYNFIKKTSGILPFYRELCMERIDVKELLLHSQYTDYEKQIKILLTLWDKYLELIQKDGYTDEWELFRNPTLDEQYLKRFKNFFFLIGGFLNSYELTQLKRVAEIGNVKIFINYIGKKHAQHKKYEKFLDYESDEDKLSFENNIIFKPLNSAAEIFTPDHPSTIYVTHNKTEQIFENYRKENAASKLLEIKATLNNSGQIDFITRKILEEHLLYGVPLENIAVILPSENNKGVFLHYDPYNLFEITSGAVLEQFLWYELLSVIDKIFEVTIDGKIFIEETKDFFATPWFRAIYDTKTYEKAIIAMIDEGIVSISTDEFVAILKKHFHAIPDIFTDFLTKDYTTPHGMLKYIQKYLLWVEKVFKTERSESNPLYATDTQVIALKTAYDYCEKLGVLLLKIDEKMTTKSAYLLVIGELKGKFVPVNKGKVAVMGLLESRNMQYDTVFIPNMNKGDFPAQSRKDMYINSELRRGLDFPTFQDREHLQKNYVLQILARAKRSYITFIKDEEKSPTVFIEEIIANTGLSQTKIELFTPEKYMIFPAYKTFKRNAIVEVKKSGSILNDIAKIPYYSPTSLDVYRKCTLKFYYRYLKHLKPKETVTYDADSSVIGRIYHDVLEDLHKENLTPLDFDNYVNTFKTKFDEKTTKQEIFINNPVNAFKAKLLINQIPRLAEKEREYYHEALLNGYNILTVAAEYSVKTNWCGYPLQGICDRVDLLYPKNSKDDRKKAELIQNAFKNGDQEAIFNNLMPGMLFNLIDYKYKSELKEYSEKIEYNKLELQLPLYGLMLKSWANIDTANYLWFDLKKTRGFVNAFGGTISDFGEKTKLFLDTIADASLPFTQTDDSGYCQYCDYASICGKGDEDE